MTRSWRIATCTSDTCGQGRSAGYGYAGHRAATGEARLWRGHPCPAPDGMARPGYPKDDPCAGAPPPGRAHPAARCLTGDQVHGGSSAGRAAGHRLGGGQWRWRCASTTSAGIDGRSQPGTRRASAALSRPGLPGTGPADRHGSLRPCPRTTRRSACRCRARQPVPRPGSLRTRRCAPGTCTACCSPAISPSACATGFPDISRSSRSSPLLGSSRTSLGTCTSRRARRSRHGCGGNTWSWSPTMSRLPARQHPGAARMD